MLGGLVRKAPLLLRAYSCLTTFRILSSALGASFITMSRSRCVGCQCFPNTVPVTFPCGIGLSGPVWILGGALGLNSVWSTTSDEDRADSLTEDLVQSEAAPSGLDLVINPSYDCPSVLPSHWYCSCRSSSLSSIIICDSLCGLAMSNAIWDSTRELGLCRTIWNSAREVVVTSAI